MAIYAGDTVKQQFTLNSTVAPFGPADPDTATDFTGLVIRNGLDTTVAVTLTRLDLGLYQAAFQIPVIWRRADILQLRITSTIDGVARDQIVWTDSLSAGTSQPGQLDPRSTGQEGNPDHFGGAQVKAKRPTIVVRASHNALVHCNLGINGLPLDLEALGFATSEVGGASEPLPNVVVKLSEMMASDGTEIYADLIDLSTNLIGFELPTSITDAPGLWLMEYALLLEDGTRQFAGDAYLYIEQTGGAPRVGMPTIPELRLFLRDFAQENELIDVVDFDASEMALAAQLCVDEWNESPPPDGPRYTTATFPYRRNWLIGITSYLYGMAADHYMRNALQYQAGGVSSDDKGKHTLYLQRREMARQEWQSFMRQRKTIASINSGYLEIPGVLW